MTKQNLPAPDDRRQFASDNYSGICPEAWESLAAANQGHVSSYGDDAWTDRAADALRELFETQCEVFFVFNGTAANALALASLCQSYHSIICHELAHVEMDECGAAEFFSNGTKVLTAPGAHAKVTPGAIEFLVAKRSDIHYPKPRAVSISQPTELGTVYSVAEVVAIGETCQPLGLKLHRDGARLANAIAALGVKPKEITWQVGVDVLCFGGAKNGVPLGEAVIFFNRALADEFDYRCKQAGQLASKMRFMAAPWLGLLQSGAWLRNATRANATAELLESELRKLPGVGILHPRQVNSVFAKFPQHAIDELYRRGWKFYQFIGSGGSRLMCTWDTTDEDVRAFVADLRAAL
jgi:threonine aldolase